MEAHRTIRYRLYPKTYEKHQKLHGTAGACRYVWNYFVGKLQDDYARCGECDYRFFSIGKDFTIIRNHYDKWLKGYSAYIVKSSLQPIETCYREFFKDQGRLQRKLPKFHGKYRTVPSFPINYVSAKIAEPYLHTESRLDEV